MALLLLRHAARRGRWCPWDGASAAFSTPASVLIYRTCFCPSPPLRHPNRPTVPCPRGAGAGRRGRGVLRKGRDRLAAGDDRREHPVAAGLRAVGIVAAVQTDLRLLRV